MYATKVRECEYEYFFSRLFEVIIAEDLVHLFVWLKDRSRHHHPNRLRHVGDQI